MNFKYRTIKVATPLDPGDSGYFVKRSSSHYIYNEDRPDTYVGWIPLSEFAGCPLESGVEYPVTINGDNTLEILAPRTVYVGVSDFTQTKQPKKVNMLTQVLETNKAAMKQAAYLEAGRVATSTLQTIVASRFPNLPDTPFNALILANLADVMGKQIKPSAQLQKVTQAMVTSAYTDLFQGLDIDGMIAELLTATKDMDIEA